MLFLLFTVLWGLVATAILQAVFYHLMDFRSQWFDTLFAAVLTGGVVGAGYFCADRVFDVGAKLGMLKVLGSSFALAFGAGLLAFRFMIKSEAGTYLSWAASAVVTLLLVLPPLLVMFLVLATSS
jgi:hypothetical protein